jgi:hypothetical protein
VAECDQDLRDGSVSRLRVLDRSVHLRRPRQSSRDRLTQFFLQPLHTPRERKGAQPVPCLGSYIRISRHQLITTLSKSGACVARRQPDEGDLLGREARSHVGKNSCRLPRRKSLGRAKPCILYSTFLTIATRRVWSHPGRPPSTYELEPQGPGESEKGERIGVIGTTGAGICEVAARSGYEGDPGDQRGIDRLRARAYSKADTLELAAISAAAFAAGAVNAIAGRYGDQLPDTSLDRARPDRRNATNQVACGRA